MNQSKELNIKKVNFPVIECGSQNCGKEELTVITTLLIQRKYIELDCQAPSCSISGRADFWNYRLAPPSLHRSLHLRYLRLRHCEYHLVILSERHILHARRRAGKRFVHCSRNHPACEGIHGKRDSGWFLASPGMKQSKAYR